MANLNVLPQVNASSSVSATELLAGESKTQALKGSAQGVELSKEFQTNLTDASQEKSTLAKQFQTTETPTGQIQFNQTEGQTEVVKALQSSQKEASEKAGEAAIQAGINPRVVPLSIMPKGQMVEENSSKSQALKVHQTKMDPKLESMMAKQATIQPQIQANQVQAANSKVSEIASQSLNGVALNALSDEHAFDVDSLEVKEGSSFDSGAEVRNKMASSKLSTADYLNLRDLSQSMKKQATMTNDPISMRANPIQSPNLSNSLQVSGVGLKAVALGAKEERKSTEGAENTPVILLGSQQNGFHAQKTVDAPVTQGSNQKVILSHDAVHQITSQVNVLHQAKQDGEIKIRLRPDHLGELQMSVKTQGQAVSIQIKAQDGEAKKIIEESLGSLRDSLSQQNLSLSRVDIVTQSQHAAQSDSGMQFDLGQGQFRQDHDSRSFQGSEQGSRQDRYFEDDAKSVNLNASQASRLRARSGLSNLDLIA